MLITDLILKHPSIPVLNATQPPTSPASPYTSPLPPLPSPQQALSPPPGPTTMPLPSELLSLILTHTLHAALLTDDLPVHALAAEMTHGKLSYAGFITKTLDTRHHDFLLRTSINLVAALPQHAHDVRRAWRALVEMRRREAWQLHVRNARFIAEAGGEEVLSRQARLEVWEARLWIRMAARLRVDAGIWEEVCIEWGMGREGDVGEKAEGMRKTLREVERREESSAAREREAAMRIGMREEVAQEG